MSQKIFLSACLIVRDSEEDLAWCLDGLAGEVDEIVVVDTGSQDATKRIARHYTKRIYEFRWQDDFSAARNFALSKARGAWVFFVDSDERLTDASRGGRLRHAAWQAAEKGLATLSLVRHEVDFQGQPMQDMPDNHAVRLMRRQKGLRYHDPIHEYLAYDDGRKVRSEDVPADVVALWHRGYAPERLEAKRTRNLMLLERMERTGAKKPYLHYYLMGLYYFKERWEDVCREAELSLAEGEHPPEGALEVWRNYQMALEKIGDEARMRQLLVRTLREAPELPETYVRLAVFAMMDEDFATAERYLLESKAREEAFATACPTDYDTFRQTLPQVEHLLAQCREQLGEKALQEGSAPSTSPSSDARSSTPSRENTTDSSVRLQEEHILITSLIPLTSRCVVEFGCGRGESGAEFLRRQPEARYYGVTSRAEEVAAASRALTGAVCGTPEQMDLSLFGLTEVDCIAYDMEAAAGCTVASLRRQAAALTDDGQMVFVLRNPSYIRDLMQRTLGMAEQALASETPSALVQKLKEAGLAQFFVEPKYRADDEELRKDAHVQAFLQQATDWREAQGEKQNVDFWAHAYVVRATKKQQGTMSVQSLLGEALVTARIRITEPGACIDAMPGFFVRQSQNQFNVQLARQMQASILIRQRRGFVDFDEAWETTERMRQGGHILIYEMDDNPILWQQKNIASRFMDFRGSHAVQVSTPVLAEIVRPYNPHVFVFENQLYRLPERRDYAAEAKARNGRVTIFFGALNREKDWQDILPAINRIAAKYAGKVFFRVLADGLFFNALETNDKEFVKERSLYNGRYVPYDVYEKTLHTADISLLPLHDTEFNRAKSDLKFIESAGHGAVVLASPTVYERTIVDGCTGCIYRDPEDFEQKLEGLIVNTYVRRTIARAAYQYVRENRLLSQHYMERVHAYRWLAAHKAELDQELDARLAAVKKEG